MKNFKVLIIAVAGCLAMASCSDDDSGASLSADLTGTFSLTGLVAPTEQDYDDDGESNSNLALEGDCYNQSWISFKSDGTYEESYRSSAAGAGGLMLSCSTVVSSGTYEKDGNTVMTTDSQTDAATTFTFNSNAKTLKRTESNGTYASWDAVGNIWTQLTGSLQLTYTKYTEDEDDNGDNI